MVLLRDVQGGVYKFKSISECLNLGVPTPVFPDKVRGHMVLVLSGVPKKLDYVKVMTITSTLKDDGDYVPISPTLKKGYAIQLRFRNYLVGHNGDTRFFPMLPKYSYLKIDSYYEVPIQMLVDVKDSLGNPLMVPSKRQGGLGELRNYLRRRDPIRGQGELCHTGEKRTPLFNTVCSYENMQFAHPDNRLSNRQFGTLSQGNCG